jgi:hypothetical protein
MRSRVRLPVLPWGFFLEEEVPHGDQGLGSLVELRFKTPPGKKADKVPHWGTSAPQPKAYCVLTPKEFLHSSLEALHTERYAAPQLAKEGTM